MSQTPVRDILARLVANYPDGGVNWAGGAETRAMWAEAREVLHHHEDIPRNMPIPGTGMILRRCENCGRLDELPAQLCMVILSNCSACVAEAQVEKLARDLRAAEDKLLKMADEAVMAKVFDAILSDPDVAAVFARPTEPTPGYNGCQCACHRTAGIMHCVPCCHPAGPE